VPFELGEASKYRQHQPPVWRGGVRPCIVQRTEGGLGGTDADWPTARFDEDRSAIDIAFARHRTAEYF
jgi:hypothetical protein